MDKQSREKKGVVGSSETKGILISWHCATSQLTAVFVPVGSTATYAADLKWIWLSQDYKNCGLGREGFCCCQHIALWFSQKLLLSWMQPYRFLYNPSPLSGQCVGHYSCLIPSTPSILAVSGFDTLHRISVSSATSIFTPEYNSRAVLPMCTITG